jgi:hypothetical protein
VKEVYKEPIGDWQARIWDTGEEMGEFRYAAELTYRKNLQPDEHQDSWVGKAYPTLEEAKAALDRVVKEKGLY